MRKFLILVKKEVKELLTPQMLVPFLAVMLVFVFIGKVVGKESAKSLRQPTVAVLDLDRSEISQIAAAAATSAGNAVVLEDLSDISQGLKQAKEKGLKSLLVIPSGFGQGIAEVKPQKVEAYTILKNFSVSGSRGDQQLAVAIAAANEAISDRLITQKITEQKPQDLKNPVRTQNFVLVGNKQAEVAPAAISGLLTSQTTFIPIVLFLVIVFASQLIAYSVATEKENKTLETLLSTPVSRNAIVASKLVGAGLVALLIAIVYIFGMRQYINGVTGGAAATPALEATQAAAQQLGLVLTTPDYLLLGLSLFFGILAALSVAMILSVFAEDAKGAQGIVAPLMVLVLIPYFLTLFLDISTLSPGLKLLVYAIPFAHPFLAAPNIFLGQYQPVIYGILYMAAFFIIAVLIASKIFSSDKILTMRLNLKRKK